MALFNRIVTSCLLFISTPLLLIAQDTEQAVNKINLRLEGTALLGIATGDVELQIEGVTRAGEDLRNVSVNDKTRLKITSLPEIGVSRLVTVKISKLLDGTELTAQALSPTSTNFTGTIGTLASGVKLNTNDQILISDIGTCWSGTDVDDGYVIKYSYGIKNPTQGETINIENQTQVTVTFTLADAQ